MTVAAAAAALTAASLSAEAEPVELTPTAFTAMVPVSAGDGLTARIAEVHAVTQHTPTLCALIVVEEEK